MSEQGKGPSGPGLSELQREARAIKRRARNAERAAEDRVLGRGPWRRTFEVLEESEGFRAGQRVECVFGEPLWTIGVRGKVTRVTRSTMGTVDVHVELDQQMGREKEVALPPFCWKRI